MLHPTAPIGPVSSQGGAHITRWFDLATYPVTLAEPESPPGLEEAVLRVHRILDGLVAEGVPSDRIVLGGFSQGGAAAIVAGLCYPSSLGGICAVSGWCPYRRTLRPHIHAANVGVPVWFSCGTSDPVVDFRLAKASGAQLAHELQEASVMHVNRASHPPKHAEMEAATRFIEHCLS